MAKQVTRWEDSKGVLHSTKDQAEEADRDNALRDSLVAFMRRRWSLGSIHDISQFIMDNKDEILGILLAAQGPKER